MSLFGQKPAGTSLFGNTTSPFGTSNNNAQQQPQPQQQGSGLFGNANQGNNQQQSGGGLFGSAQNTNQQQSGGLFGSNQNNNQTQSGGLFGATQNSNQQGGGLFGSTQNNQQGGGLFGSAQNNQQSGGLFGNTNNQQMNQPPGGGLFGSSQQQQQQQQQPQQQQQQQQQGSLFGASNQPMNTSQQQPLNGSLWQPGSVGAAYEKTIPQQMLTLYEKWSPESQNCLFQRYLYNSVPENTVIYHRPNDGDDEQKWEEALANKPDNSSIPVLCRGFPSLGERLTIQARSVQALQLRLHEIYQSITAINQAHEIDISVRAADAKRKHVALSQRCLRLATKVQVLRNRGYVLDAAEEELRKKLDDLERKTFDPSLSGRQEEIWARLVNVRERARFLQEEIEKNASHSQPKDDVFDDAITKKTKDVLNDYDKHIVHLRKEIEEISKDYKEWEASSTAAR